MPPFRNKPDSRERTKNSNPHDSSHGQRYEILAEGFFKEILCLERKRAARSRRLFLLMLIDAGRILQADERENLVRKMLSALSSSTRETDITGWYEQNSVLGVIFTEIAEADKNSILSVMRAKTTAALHSHLHSKQNDKIQVSFHFFPEDWNKQNLGSAADGKLYPDLFERESSRRMSNLIKRIMDIVGSTVALIVLAPLFIVISVAIKLTSKGPILFKQKRVGKYGVTFTFLKFRSMKEVNDMDIHKEYVKRFIAGKADSEQTEGSQNGVYKITEDPRVTRVGKFLRRTSLDELPQVWNVLKGEMSLVGPRPPIPYEIESYDVWHRSRVLEAKPGITGLWQVNGRSRTKFDEMVRLDLRYARNSSLWLDIKILLRTPRAVFSGDGAY